MLNRGDSIKFCGMSFLRGLGSNIFPAGTNWNLSFGKEENHYKQCLLLTIHGVVYHDQWYQNLLRHQVRPEQLHFHCLVLIIDQSLKFQVHLVVIIGIDIHFVLLIKKMGKI